MSQEDVHGHLPPQDTAGVGNINITIDELVEVIVRAMLLHQEAFHMQASQDMNLNNSACGF